MITSRRRSIRRKRLLEDDTPQSQTGRTASLYRPSLREGRGQGHSPSVQPDCVRAIPCGDGGGETPIAPPARWDTQCPCTGRLCLQTVSADCVCGLCPRSPLWGERYGGSVTLSADCVCVPVPSCAQPLIHLLLDGLSLFRWHQVFAVDVDSGEIWMQVLCQAIQHLR